ncbi:Rhomboid protein 1 [Yarrowia sp. C11]|nr:Rhomboid protein 1 [Yarrowia sp. E02]KAG5372370.1 Rhomboid protein 1 [Yarrowia sp. C11]
MNFFRGNIVLGRLAPSFWKSTQTLSSTSNPIVKNVVGPTPGQINTMFRQMQRLGKRGGVADMLKETRGKLNAFKNDTKTFGYNAKSLFTARPFTNFAYGDGARWVYPGGDPTRYILAKALAFTIGTIVVSYFAFPLLFKYTPMSVFAQRPDWMISAIIGINAAFFMLWKSRNPWIMRFMFDNMLLKTGPAFRPAQLIGSGFSQQEFWHIFTNMFVLYQFGIPVAMTMGSAWFCHMYMSSIVVSSFASLLVPSLLGRAVMSLGASGAVFSVVGVFSSVFPDASIGLFFIPLPFGAWWFFIGSIAMNAAGIVGRWGRYDYAGHLGGSMSGLYFGWRVNQHRAAAREHMRRRGYPGFRF